MSKTDLESLRKRADALHRRYLAHYAGQPRISRDPKALQLMVREADELTGALRRLPAAQQMQLARVLRENRDLYAQEVKAIQQAQAGGDEALYAHHLANQAATGIAHITPEGRILRANDKFWGLLVFSAISDGTQS